MTEAPATKVTKRTGARRIAREAALQLLFFMEASGQDFATAGPAFFRYFETDVEGREYAETAALGVETTITRIDELIRSAAMHWRMERMARVDRNVLRLGTWELVHAIEIPRAVVLDEAVELAKRYGTDESSAFVNGILNRIADLLRRADGPHTVSADPVSGDTATLSKTSDGSSSGHL